MESESRAPECELVITYVNLVSFSSHFFSGGLGYWNVRHSPL